MKRLLFAAFLSLSLAACQKDKQDPQPNSQPTETNDWYILRAPNNRAIVAVAGDIDGTITITTNFKIYLTKDRGKSWITSNYSHHFGLMGLMQKQDTLFAMSTILGNRYDSSAWNRTDYAASPFQFSLDQGLNWRDYNDKYPSTIRVPLNRLTNTTGTQYSIEYTLIPISPSSSYIESVGIETSTGQHIKLPQAHQLQSIYFDKKSRLYIAASAPVCGSGKDFGFCGDLKGVLYISKQPLL